MDERDTGGRGYVAWQPYADGEAMWDDPRWEFEDDAGSPQKVGGPREFTHTLGTLINGLIERRFRILGLWEDGEGDPDADLGTWEHFQSVMPPYLVIWAERE